MRDRTSCTEEVRVGLLPTDVKVITLNMMRKQKAIFLL